MKTQFLTSFYLTTSVLFGFDIQTVDLTKKGKEKSELPYTIAEDGKRIYKDIGRIVEPMNVMVVYPVDSNASQKSKVVQTNEDTKKIEKNAEEEMASVFATLNEEESEIENIHTENNQVELNNDVNKSQPVNLEE